MKSNNRKILQKEILKIMKEISKICDKHNIKYSILGGTLLGAVRHKGFIPWDDDLDIGMLRDDYEKFLQIAEKELPDPFFIQHMNNEKNYGLLFAKVRNKNTIMNEEYSKNVQIRNGIWVDIFPYDNIMDNQKKALKFFKMTKNINSFLTIKLGYKYNTNNLLLNVSYYIIKFITIFISTKTLKSILNKRMTKFKDYKTKNMIVFGAQYTYEKEIRNNNFFKNLTKYKFENIEVYGIQDYDTYLTQMYGDYMKLPPESERVTHVDDFEIKINNTD